MSTRRMAVIALTLLPAFLSVDAQAPNPIAGWRCFATCMRDSVTRSEGLASAMVGSDGAAGTMNQAMKPDGFRGKRIRYSAMVKTDSIASALGAGLWMRVDGVDVGQVLQFDNMMDRPIPPLMDWQRYAIVLDVPEESSYIVWGLIVNGRGKAWIDDVRIEVVDGTTPSTHRAGSERHAPHDVTPERIATTMRARETASSAPVNLTFESKP
jgi:hypothetical protein